MGKGFHWASVFGEETGWQYGFSFNRILKVFIELVNAKEANPKSFHRTTSPPDSTSSLGILLPK